MIRIMRKCLVFLRMRSLTSVRMPRKESSVSATWTKVALVSLGMLILASPAGYAQEAEPAAAPEEAETKIPGTGSDTFIQVQVHKILLTFVDFHKHEPLRAAKEQMRSIPGVTDFIPHTATKGLITYDVRYSGTPRLLMKALKDTIGVKYELGLKEIAKKEWEITVRKL